MSRSRFPFVYGRILRIALCALALMSLSIRASAGEVLVPWNSSWRFHRGETPPSEPDPTRWRYRRFCDGDWEVGRTSIGYGDDDDATILTDMQGRYVSVFARTEFHVEDASRIETLRLTADYDDGFVCYLNGVEVARANCGEIGEELGYDGLANGSHEAGTIEYFDLTLFRNELSNGVNVLAVEVHNGTLESSDLTIDLRLTANEPRLTGPAVVIEAGSEWRFFRGRTAPSDPDATAWRETDFDDSKWESGPTSIGYGDDDDATVLDDMIESYVTLYTRREFEIFDRGSVSSLLLGINYDDGFVCYVNGQEAARAYAGGVGEELAFDSVSTGSHESGTFERFDLEGVRSALRTGRNVIAVEVHNAAYSSSDLTFDVQLEINSRPPGNFEDSGIDLGGGKAAWADIDGDGFADLIASSGIFRNDRGQRFERMSSGGDSIVGDFDNDGDLDLFDYGGRRLRRNDGDWVFTDVTEAMIPALPMSVTRGAVWADFDGDSFLDLYIGGYEAPGYQPDAILLNEQGQRFRLAWTQSGDVDPSRGITACDFDEDFDMDVYVSNYRLEQNQLWRNNGRATFENAGPALGVHGIYDGWGHSHGHTIGSSWGDLDSDGDFDLFVGNFSHPQEWQDRPFFYENLGRAEGFRFADRTGASGLAWQESFASPTLGDIDNDGDLDLYFTCVYNGNRSVLYVNHGGFRFSEETSARGLATYVTYQAAWADVDNDGDLDLTTGGRLLRNTGTQGASRWLAVRLRGDGVNVNTTAIGAQVRAALDGRTLARQVDSSTGEGNQNDLTLHFGLGSHTGPVPIEVRWPDGLIEETLLEPNRIVELEYGFTSCHIERHLPPSYQEGDDSPIVVEISARNVPGATTIIETVPEDWVIVSTSEGTIEANTVLFTVDNDSDVDLSYEVVPAGDCAEARIQGRVFGPGDECGSEVEGASTLSCEPRSFVRTLVEEGSDLTFHRGTVPPDPSWRSVDFDDCGWEAGRFGIGYGDADDQTTLEDMSGGYAAVFCRAIFDLEDHGTSADLVESMTLRVRFDDGFVAYLNGREIGRANMPGGSPTEQTFANATVSDAPHDCEVGDPANGCAVITVPASGIRDGTNVLSFSVHNATLASSDLTLIPHLAVTIGEAPTDLFRRGDTDSSGLIEITDAIVALEYLFLGGAPPTCPDSADVDDNGTLGLSDAIVLLAALFQGGIEDVPSPGFECGEDPTDDELGDCSTLGCE